MEFSKLNRWSIRTGYLLLAVLMSSIVFGQQQPRKWWQPDHLKLQYAGGIGFMAAGVGFESNNKKFETDIYYGFLPESIGGEDIHSATLKWNWFPFGEKKIQNWQVKPLSVGLLINYSFGSQYYSFDPRNYPFDYYRIPTSLNTAILIGGQIGRNIDRKISSRSISAYYEIGSFDREMLSYLVNMRALSLTDILTLGFGVKYSF